MNERLLGLWAHLQTLPVFWLALTLGVFHLASLVGLVWRSVVLWLLLLALTTMAHSVG